MLSDPLDLIWRSADVEFPVFAREEIEPGRALLELGLLRPGKTASHVTCEACGEVHRVATIKYPGGQVRFFARCPQNGRIELDRDDLLQWSVNFVPMLRALADGLGIKTDPEEIVSVRLWKIGRAAIAGRSRVAWAARGLSWPDARDVAERLPKGRSPVLFLLGNPPENGFVNLLPDAIIGLREVVSLSNGRLVFDRKGVNDQLSAIPEPAKTKVPKKRASRAATIEALEKALIEHLNAARDHARAAIEHNTTPELLPRPMQKNLAAQVGVPESAVSRALRDPAARMVKVLWDAADDLDQVLKFRPRRRS